MASTASTAAAESTTTNNNNVHEIAIVGGGIVGLVLALALHKIGIVSVEIYEREPAFHADVGAGQGMYSNGLRVIRDLSPELLEKVREAGFPYQYRRWERHDGTEVAVANETVLSDKDDEHIQSIGIRRWRLLNVLYEAVVEAGIPVHFGKKLVGVNSDENGVVQVSFEDGTFMNTQVLFAADGSKSTVRSIIQPSSELKYTGVTCVMGMAENSKPEDVGILFPSSVTSNCHGCFFPTSEEEQCFQMHFPLSESDADEGNWGTLSETVGISECLRLSQAMKEDGWHEKYTSPLLQVTHAVKIGFCSLDPPLSTWVSGKIVLLGDAAHPPVPYTGQGAQQGLEDAGTIAMLLEKYCFSPEGILNLENFDNVMKLYQHIRIPRTLEINKISKSWGDFQTKRSANGELYRNSKEETIKRNVFFHETLPALIPGSTYNYRQAVEEFLEKEPPMHLPPVQEE